MIRQVEDSDTKKEIAERILSALPDWFGIPEATQAYISQSAEEPFFAAFENDMPIGFAYLHETGRDTLELYVMGVLQPYHRHGIGRQLVLRAKQFAKENCYSFLQVKTVQMGRYPQYDETNRFYLSLGFRELEVFPTLWDECNPCQIYVMYVG